jgi:hypothetical protein
MEWNWENYSYLHAQDIIIYKLWKLYVKYLNFKFLNLMEIYLTFVLW